ncbi:hypothetical protein WDW86_21870 [Bdellovibrionota bacterium FG-2]
MTKLYPEMKQSALNEVGARAELTSRGASTNVGGSATISDTFINKHDDKHDDNDELVLEGSLGGVRNTTTGASSLVGSAGMSFNKYPNKEHKSTDGSMMTNLMIVGVDANAETIRGRLLEVGITSKDGTFGPLAARLKVELLLLGAYARRTNQKKTGLYGMGMRFTGLADIGEVASLFISGEGSATGAEDLQWLAIGKAGVKFHLGENVALGAEVEYDGSAYRKPTPSSDFDMVNSLTSSITASGAW